MTEHLQKPLKIVFVGLTISSSWGNSHAATYRSLARALSRRGHEVTFLERDQIWYRQNRDLLDPHYIQLHHYDSIQELRDACTPLIQKADLVVLGSKVQDGVSIAEWILSEAKGIRAFYDLNTPMTLDHLRLGDSESLSAELIPDFDLYLSSSGGPILQTLEAEFGAQRALPLYCSVELDDYYPDYGIHVGYEIGFLGTYAADRQQKLEVLFLESARRHRRGRFIVAGSQYPEEMDWPKNVIYRPHLPPSEHRHFYNSQRYTIHLSREPMDRIGYSPNMRLFEAAACGTPILTDDWTGLEEFFDPNSELFVVRNSDEILRLLKRDADAERRRRASRLRERIRLNHSSTHRARELEAYVQDALKNRLPRFTQRMGSTHGYRDVSQPQTPN